MAGIYFDNGNYLDWETVKTVALNDKTEHSKVLSFCQQWLQGQEFFSLHTSGSTGSPKMNQIHRRRMVASAKATAQALGLQANDNALVCLNTDYIAGKMMLVRCMEIGMNAYLVPPTANPLENINHQTKWHFCGFVPLQIQQLIDQQNEDYFRFAKAIIVGGAPVSNSLATQINRFEAPVYATYGMTETVSHIALKRLNGTEKKDFYTLLPNIDIGQDTRGCLTVCAAVTDFETIVTNDLVRLINKQDFEWIGRADNIINSGGVKVQAEKIEQVVGLFMQEKTLNNRFFITSMADERLGQKIVLIIEGTVWEKTQIDMLIDFLKTKLGKYEMPKNILFKPFFAETPTGKIIRII